MGYRRREFEEWLSSPLPVTSSDPRLEVRRAEPSDFEQIYALVDGMSEPRSKERYDWLYRRNPCGLARCWMVIERKSGRLIGAEAKIPWPFYRGSEPIDGTVAVDAFTAPQWQRQGVYAQLRRFGKGHHPWETVSIGWNNSTSREALRKHGDSKLILGPLLRWAFVLRATPILEARGLHRALTWPAVWAAEAWRATWEAISSDGGRDLRLEEVKRFDSAFDPLPLRSMRRDHLWSCHAADFLNWRYVDHPTRSYLRFALVDQDGALVGYYVLRIEEDRALLMDFVVSEQPQRQAAALLSHALGRAREAGCTYLDFFASTGAIHGRLLRRRGFVRAPCSVYMSSRGPGQFETTSLEKWQLVPGDCDGY